MKFSKKYALGAVLLCSSALTLSGCSWFGGSWFGKSEPKYGKTLSELPAATMPNTNNAVAIVDREKILQSYEKALASAEDPVLRQQIMVRIADFEMIRSEEQQIAATEAGHFFDKPIAMYRELISMQEQNASKTKGVELDRLRYKLAKALSMDGRNDEAHLSLDQLAQTAPASPFIAETQFRRAEKAFAEGNYSVAEKHYESVAADKNNPLQQNALYMQGWAEFKRSDYETALQSFTKVMDQFLGSASKPEEVDAVIKQLPPAKANMMNDTLHVMSLSFSYLEGANSIAELQKNMGNRVYEHALYEQLGQLYLEQKRFTDSAETYKTFVEQNPLSNFAPRFSMKMIHVYEQGNFPSLILPAKRDFVSHYGIESDYWAKHQGLLDEESMAYLHQSLEELAEYEHAQAQELATTNKAESKAAYGRAANLYSQFVTGFPKDPKAAEMSFLLAESLNESGNYIQAVEYYDRVAYEYKDKAHGAEAGYATVFLSQMLSQSASLTQKEKLDWSEHKINYAMRFAEAYPADPRAAPVLTQAAQELLALKRYSEAATVAEEVINLKPPADAKLQFTAWLVLGHSNFDDKNYAGAEQAYWQVLNMLPSQAQHANAPTAQSIRERIAASIYQQAQADLAANQKDAAIKKLLRISEVAPDTEVAIKAYYDAGVYLMEEQKWADAEKVYVQFRQQYPKNELSATIPAKLVVIYQNQSKWAQAATELGIMERSSNDPNVKRQALALGAELYEKSGNSNMALEQYQRYANEYPKPVAEAMEVEFKLANMYGAMKDTQRHRYWLQRMIDANASAGAQATDRTKYLAASSQNELADIPYQEFATAQLTLPLKASLKNKRAALDRALKAQEAVLAYGIGEFTTQASFKIAEIYAQLSRDLMASQRPKDLDELALEQYNVLLEEQATPFEEKAIQIHQTNAQRSWKGTYDPWVKRSFEALAKLLPARYKKPESVLEVSNEIQ